MTAWVRLQLNHGILAGKRLLSSGAVNETQKSHSIIPSEPPWSLIFPEAHFITYGLGWFLYDYRGRKIVDHGGNIDGMSALVAFIPEEKLGLVILTNLSGSELRTALKYRIFDAFMGGEKKDWSAIHLKTMKGFEAQGKAADGVFSDAAEVESVVVFDDVGDFGVAVGGVVLEVFDDAAVLIEGDDEGVTLWGRLEKFGEANHYLAQKWIGQQYAIEKSLAGSHESQPELVAAV